MTLRNMNTIHVIRLSSYLELTLKKEFINSDKPTILRDFASQLWTKVISGEVISSPQSLHDFVLLTFADLKNYKFTYWYFLQHPFWCNLHFMYVVLIGLRSQLSFPSFPFCWSPPQPLPPLYPISHLYICSGLSVKGEDRIG